MEPNTNEATAPKRLKTGGRKPLIIIGIIVGILVILLGAAYVGVCAYAGSLDVFYPNFHINGVDVSGLTVQEAQEKLEQETPKREIPIYDAADPVYTEDNPRTPLMTVTLEELGFSPEAVTAGNCAEPFENWAQDSMDDLQNYGFFMKGRMYLRALTGRYTGTWLGYELSGDQFEHAVDAIAERLSEAAVDGAYTVEETAISITKARDGRSLDKAELRNRLSFAGCRPASVEESSGIDVEFTVISAKTLTAQEIYDDCSGVVKNASYDKETGTIVPEEAGADFDVAEAQRLLDAAEPGETVTVPAQVELPAVTAEELEQVLFRDVLGEARTHVGGTSARRSNVKLSAASINEYVMNSGDVFSYNDVVGQRTAARGYQAAPAYVQGETVDEIGGGICQTSSTLYLACLRSNLEITERYAHRYVPAYITAGMDATVSWGGPDYKFTNDSLYPIKIVTRYENNYLTVQILGTNVDGTSVKMTNEWLSTTPYETVYEDDPTLAPGTEQVKTTPYTGYKYRTYRNVYDADGKLISSTYEATSDYKSRNKVILRGPAVETAGGDAQLPDGTTDPADPTTPTEPTEPQDPNVPAEPAEPAAPDDGWTIQTPEQGGQQAADQAGGTGASGETGTSADVLPQDEPFV